MLTESDVNLNPGDSVAPLEEFAEIATGDSNY